MIDSHTTFHKLNEKYITLSASFFDAFFSWVFFGFDFKLPFPPSRELFSPPFLSFLPLGGIASNSWLSSCKSDLQSILQRGRRKGER